MSNPEANNGLQDVVAPRKRLMPKSSDSSNHYAWGKLMESLKDRINIIWQPSNLS